ncbi:MAG: amidohydrolase family protein [Actinomycetales bacterium]|nr:amidohydrolase family protein [Actinomycetales bacterium]
MTTRIENATVWTPAESGEGYVEYSAVAFDQSGILAVGDEAMSHAAENVIDAQGAFVCPGFRDGHAHPIPGGFETLIAPVRGHATPQAIAAAVGTWARDHSDVEWIRGEGFDHTLAPGGIFHAAWLDAEVPDRPVVLRATDYHTVWVNSEALRRAGFTSTTPQPHDGEIVRDESGAPVGTLREWGAWRPVYDLLPPKTHDQVVASIATASEAFASTGVTWVQDAWVEPEDVDAWLTGLAAGVLDIRVDLGLWCDPNTWRDQLEHFLEARNRVVQHGEGLLSANTVKFFADGVLESATGAMLEPYCDCPHSKGLPNWDPEELALAVAAVDALGFDPHIHAIGDAAVRNALNAFETMLAANERRDRRMTIAHAQLVDAADLGRFSTLGVTANFEPYWAKYDEWQSELTAPRLGDERTNRQFMMRTILDSGANVSFGSDWPVTTQAPLEGIQVAVTRQMTDGPFREPWMPEERLTVEQALRAYTRSVAYQAGDPRGGVIAPGYGSDIVMIERDPRQVDPLEIGALKVLGTWRDGTAVFGPVRGEGHTGSS